MQSCVQLRSQTIVYNNDRATGCHKAMKAHICEHMTHQQRKYQLGHAVRSRTKNKWYPATVIAITPSGFEIEYDGKPFWYGNTIMRIRGQPYIEPGCGEHAESRMRSSPHPR